MYFWASMSGASLRWTGSAGFARLGCTSVLFAGSKFKALTSLVSVEGLAPGVDASCSAGCLPTVLGTFAAFRSVDSDGCLSARIFA